MRRFLALGLLAGVFAMPAAALAQGADDEGPVIDVVEVAGIIDRPLYNYIVERIDEAEREGAELLVFQLDSLGGLKVDGLMLAYRIAEAEVPVGVFVGPRRARAAGLAAAVLGWADVVGVGPSTRIGPVVPADHGTGPPRATDPTGSAMIREGKPSVRLGAPERADPLATYGANDAVGAGYADFVVPSLAELLVRADGMTVETAGGAATLDLPRDEVTVRFFQPGPIRRLLHTFSNPTLVYLLLLGGALLVVFELFQPGFGVAGVTGGLLLFAATYGLTVLPANWYGLGLLALALGFLTLDVALDQLALPTIVGGFALVAGSLWLYPNSAEPVALSKWVVGLTVASALIFFVPVMTVVRRARQPIAREVKTQLIGELGQVRSMLNPEGFVLVEGEVWRARSADGARVRVGEDVVVEAVDGTVLIVRGPGSATPA